MFRCMDTKMDSILIWVASHFNHRKIHALKSFITELIPNIQYFIQMGLPASYSFSYSAFYTPNEYIVNLGRSWNTTFSVPHHHQRMIKILTMRNFKLWPLIHGIKWLHNWCGSYVVRACNRGFFYCFQHILGGMCSNSTLVGRYTLVVPLTIVYLITFLGCLLVTNIQGKGLYSHHFNHSFIRSSLFWCIFVVSCIKLETVINTVAGSLVSL